MGSYKKLLQYKFNDTAGKRLDYGVKKHVAPHDEDDTAKFWLYAENKKNNFDPFSDYDNLLETMVFF